MTYILIPTAVFGKGEEDTDVRSIKLSSVSKCCKLKSTSEKSGKFQNGLISATTTDCASIICI